MTGMFDAPIREVSGACFVDDRLLLVGDAEPVLAWTRWSEQGPGEWTTLDVAALPDAPKKTGQFEAVEHLGDSTVVILCEEPAVMVAVDIDAQRIVGWWHLEVELDGLTKSWRKDPNSHGEGFFFGPGRVFVVKEKKPAAILEFGLAGQESIGKPRPGHWTPPESGALHALAWHPIDLEDVSDVCVDQGIVWLLSDKARCVRTLDGPSISLPAGIVKPEGLARTPQESWLVAVDNPDGVNALHIVDLT